MGWSPWVALAGQPELEVLFVPGLPVCGLYAPGQQAICIRSGIGRRLRRTVLAEELAHHLLGHTAGWDRREVARMEVRAGRWAACRLISVPDLAVALVGAGSWDEVAERLDVEVGMLRVRVGCLTVAEVGELRRLVGDAEVL